LKLEIIFVILKYHCW